MDNAELNLADISQTKEISARRDIDDKINPWLNLGWVILRIWVEDYGDPSMTLETTHVLLGWRSSQGEPKIHKSRYEI